MLSEFNPALRTYTKGSRSNSSRGANLSNLPDEPDTDTTRLPGGPLWSCTLEEVSRELGVSREHVRQIEAQALRKCRLFCEARGLRLEDLLRV